VLQRKPKIKIYVWFPESILIFQHSLNIKRLKKNHLETQINARNNKRQNLSRKTATAWGIFCPLKHVKKILNFVHTGDENFQL
jgi:hypothetical protein